LDYGRNIPVKPDPQTPIKSELLDDYESNLVSLFALASAHGIIPIFATQPTLWKPTMTADEEAVDWLRPILEDRKPPYRQSSAESAREMEALNQRLMSVCNERAWKCIDLANRVPRSLDYFYDSVHFNEAGAEFVAKEVGRFVSQLELHTRR
jgi:hypothetical protein